MSVLNTLNLKSAKLVELFKESSAKNIKTEEFVSLAKKAVASAKKIGGDEVANLKEKLNVALLSEKAKVGLERGTRTFVEKIVGNDEADDALKNEVVNMLLDTSTGTSKIPSNLTFVKDVLVSAAPRNVADLKDIRSKISEKVLADAKARLADKTPTPEAEAAAAVKKAKQAKKAQVEV